MIYQEALHCPQEQQGPRTVAEFEALSRPQPVPYEGDVIGYRLLHISADWTPQVWHACLLGCHTMAWLDETLKEWESDAFLVAVSWAAELC